MRKVELQVRVIGIVVVLLVYVAGYCCAKVRWGNSVYVEVAEHVAPLALVIAGALLANWFSRRSSFTAAMRQLWFQVVPAVQEAIQYTHLPLPTDADFARTQMALSMAVDQVRAVFKNEGEDDETTGLYPYADLKRMQAEIHRLGFGAQVAGKNRRAVRCEIVEQWKRLRKEMLQEFERSKPTPSYGEA